MGLNKLAIGRCKTEFLNTLKYEHEYFIFQHGIDDFIVQQIFAVWLPKNFETLEILLIQCKFEEKCPKNGKTCKCFQITKVKKKVEWDLQNELIIGFINRCSSCHLINI